jgi:hypothetical protein
MRSGGGVRRLSSTVAWAVLPAAPGTRVARRAVHILTTVLQVLGSGYGTTRINRVRDLDGLDPRVDADPLGRVRVSGTGPGLPDGPGPWRATVRCDGLVVDAHPSDVEPVDLHLPLRRLRLVDARRLGRGGRWPRTPDARWRLHLEGGGYDVTVEGTWVLLAHLGTLGGWPQP